MTGVRVGVGMRQWSVLAQAPWTLAFLRRVKYVSCFSLLSNALSQNKIMLICCMQKIVFVVVGCSLYFKK